MDYARPLLTNKATTAPVYTARIKRQIVILVIARHVRDLAFCSLRNEEAEVDARAPSAALLCPLTVFSVSLRRY